MFDQTVATEFAHGDYGDYSGVTFYGGPADGWWTDRLDVSNRFIEPLFSAVMDVSACGRVGVPRIVNEWNLLTGWRDAMSRVPLSVADAIGLVAALGCVSAADVAPYCAGCSAMDCVRCAEAIVRFLSERAASGTPLYIEDS